MKGLSATAVTPLIFALIAGSGCSDGTRAPDSGIFAPQSSIEVAIDPQERPEPVTFQVVSTLDRELPILDVERSCSCLGIQINGAPFRAGVTPLKPGENTVSVKLGPHTVDTLHKFAVVTTKGSVQFSVRIQVQYDVRFQPSVIEFGRDELRVSTEVFLSDPVGLMGHRVEMDEQLDPAVAGISLNTEFTLGQTQSIDIFRADSAQDGRRLTVRYKSLTDAGLTVQPLTVICPKPTQASHSPAVLIIRGAADNDQTEPALARFVVEIVDPDARWQKLTGVTTKGPSRVRSVEILESQQSSLSLSLELEWSRAHPKGHVEVHCKGWPKPLTVPVLYIG